MPRTHRHGRQLDRARNQAQDPARQHPRERREPSALMSVAARVRTVSLTPQGHLACVLDTFAGRLKALSDAATVHLPELVLGREVQVTLLRFKRVTDDTVWPWLLLGCRSAEASSTRQAEQAGSAA